MPPKDATKAAGRGKKLKDPNAPAKPQSAYMMWSIESRKTLKEENPSLSFGELGKKLGETWAMLPAAEKNRWTEKAEQAKTQYEKLNNAYMKTPEFHQFQQTKAKTGVAGKAPKDKSGPKKPVTSFVAFSRDKRPTLQDTHPGISFADAGKLLGQMWAKIDPEEKKRYEIIAENDKKRYENELAGRGGSSTASSSKAASSKKAPAPAEDDDEEEDEEEDESDDDD